jgi:hypothetical protein
VEDYEEDGDATVTFQFGHSVGEGIQLLLQGKSLQDTIFSMFINWKPDLFAEDPKRKKSFALAVIAIQKFSAFRSAGFLREYELVYFKERPAVELGFRIHLPDGFKYRGFVDAVLKHKATGEVLVLEIKTSSGQVIANSYKNSAQAIGYSLVLDHLFPKLSAYKVLYLVYRTKEVEYEPIMYPKSFLQRALWIQELLLDIEVVKLYEKTGVYPMRGESCVQFFRDCKYLGVCTLSTEKITSPLTQEFLDKIAKETYDTEITIADLINSQLSHSEAQDELSNLSTDSTYIATGDDQIL